MTSILPIVVPALPSAPAAATLATIDPSVLVLPLVLVVAIAVGILLERTPRRWRRRRARRVLQVVPMRRAA